jgi:UDP-N-acetylglucosamine--N-acetylmuramyl-(pentapeptide) pyrophosphoryl-undecaprenol N-acetylglucosamine transferase
MPKNESHTAPQRILIACGGTGGHIFPALAIANEFRRQLPACELRFVGAKGGMEEERVPEAGYPIDSLWISGIQRKLTPKNILKNLEFPVKVVVAAIQARRLLDQFQPQLVIGTGGYAAYPLVSAAAERGIFTAIQEQNAFPGLSNRWVAERVDLICLGNEDARRHFKGDRAMIYTGNPVRHDLLGGDPAEARRAFGLAPDRKTLLVMGGSLGAYTINQALQTHMNQLRASPHQVIWQCGQLYYEDLRQALTPLPDHVKLQAFIKNMAQAYAAADLVVCRAGAITLSELIRLHQPALLVPSPNVAEDHQRKNADSFREQGAAEVMPDDDAPAQLTDRALQLLDQDDRLDALRQNLAAIDAQYPDSAHAIVEAIRQRMAQRKPEA